MPSRDFCTLPHKSPNVHAVFEISTLQLCTCYRHVFNAPLKNEGGLFCFFSLEINVGSLKTQISKKKKLRTKTQISDGIKTHTNL